MKCMCLVAFTAVVVWCEAVFLWGGAGAQLDPAPPCDMDAATLCVERAHESTAASGCNWYLLTPALTACVESATAGCSQQEQTTWIDIVAAYNRTLQADDCYAPCLNQTMRAGQIQSCYSSFGSVEDVVAIITSQSNYTSQHQACLAFSTLSACLVGATQGCPALIDLTYDHINDVTGSGVAYAVCGLTQFVAATSGAPLPLLDTASMMPSDTLADTVTPIPEESGMGQMVIIVLGCIVIVSTLVVIITVIVLAVRKRHASQRQSIMRDWRPNGQKVIFVDDPHAFPPTNQSPRQSGFRPQAYTDLDGILNHAAAVQ